MKKPKFRNPWADEVVPQSDGVTVEQPREMTTVFDEGDHVGAEAVADIKLPGYGGLTVHKAGSPTEAMLKVLDFCVKNRAAVDQTLTDYAILLAQFSDVPAQGFYVRRGWDGWTISVPEANNRDQAFLQIIQALLEISRGPLRAQLSAARITPYRL